MHMTNHPDGLYWVRVLPEDTQWQPARLQRGQWFIIGVGVSFDVVAELGPAIPPPFGMERV